MKLILMLFTVLLLTSCGLRDTLADRCGSGNGCEFVFGYRDNDQDKELNNHQGQINELRNRINLIESKIGNLEAKDLLILTKLDLIDSNLLALDAQDTNLQAQVTSINNSLSTTIGTILTLQTAIGTLSGQIGTLQSVDADLQAQIDALEARIFLLEGADYQAQINSVVADLAALTLSLNDAVVEIEDPCGNSPGYDEVLLKTASGKLIAYFENGGNRYLSVLLVGTNYVTTDGSNCHFHINANGDLLY